GSQRRVDYRSDDSAFLPRIRAGRATATLRREGLDGGAEATAAVDLRQGDPSLLDGRLSVWGSRGRARFRLDAESAHERPTLVDLFTPARIDTMPSSVAPTLLLVRGGDRALGARSLRG